MSKMDFTFDNPFDDVFTDPQAVQPAPVAQDAPAAVVAAEPVHNPAAVAPVEQQAPTVVQPAHTTPVTTPVTANPTQPASTTHIAPTPIHNPAIVTPQIFTPLATPSNPAVVQPVAQGTRRSSFHPIALDPASARTLLLHYPVFILIMIPRITH